MFTPCDVLAKVVVIDRLFDIALHNANKLLRLTKAYNGTHKRLRSDALLSLTTKLGSNWVAIKPLT